MAAKEMYDYLQNVSADNNQTLAVKPQRAARIIGKSTK